MGRTDFAPLRVPGWQEAEAMKPAGDTQYNLSELFNRSPRAGAAAGADQAQGPPKAASPGGTETAPASRREPVRCPHCSAGLSAAEAKLGRCLSCGKAVSGAGALVVHI